LNNKINAVFEDNLKEVLIKLKLLDPINNGEIVCRVCGDVISLETIGCMFPLDDEVQFCCDKILCIQKIIELQSTIRQIAKERIKNE